MHYRGLIIDDTNPPPTAAQLTAVEQSLGCKLPEDYLQFLNTCNGGTAEYEIEATFDDGHSESLSFSEMFSAATLLSELAEARRMEGFPARCVLPIARGGAAMLYLDLQSGYEVVALAEGLPAWTGLRQENSLVHVADSFNAYLDALYISDEAVIHCIKYFDPRYNVPEAMAEWFDTRAHDWRTRHAKIWQEHVVKRSENG